MTRLDQREPKRKHYVSRAPVTNIAPHTAVGTDSIKPCLLSGIILLHRTYVLFPLFALCFLLCSLILPSLQSSERSDLLRYAATQYRDSAGTKTETQAKLGRVEFRFLSQWKTGWGGAVRNPLLAPPTFKPLTIIPRGYLQVVLRCGRKWLVDA